MTMQTYSMWNIVDESSHTSKACWQRESYQ